MTKQIVQALEAALGTDDFAAVVDQIKRLDPRLKLDVIAVAKEFVGGRRATSRQKALKQIWSRHQQILIFKAKVRAIGGRVAA